MFKTYIGLTKPERTLANVITAGAGFLLASHRHFDPWLFIVTIAGLSLLVASACTLNNVIDSGLDAMMPRTKKRALVNGTVSKSSGLIFAVLMGVAGILLIWFFVNTLVTFLGVVAYFDYIVLYGYTKRKTKYGTWVGTVCGALPMVAGYCAVTGSIDTTAVILYFAMTFWQMAHFYAIAIYRLKDYMAGGIPVWPAAVSVKNTKIQIIVYIFAFAVVSLCLSIFGPTGFLYAAAMFLANAFWVWKGLSGWSGLADSKWAKGMFGTSLNVLLVFAAAISVGALLP